MAGQGRYECGMKRLVLCLLVAGVGFAAGMIRANRQSMVRHAQELQGMRVVWETEKAALESALANAQAEAGRTLVVPSPPSIVTNTPPRPDPQTLLNELVALRVTPGPGNALALRHAVYLLEQLKQCGPAALPAIRQFLQRNEDLE